MIAACSSSYIDFLNVQTIFCLFNTRFVKTWRLLEVNFFFDFRCKHADFTSHWCNGSLFAASDKSFKDSMFTSRCKSSKIFDSFTLFVSFGHKPIFLFFFSSCWSQFLFCMLKDRADHFCQFYALPPFYSHIYQTSLFAVPWLWPMGVFQSFAQHNRKISSLSGTTQLSSFGCNLLHRFAVNK